MKNKKKIIFVKYYRRIHSHAWWEDFGTCCAIHFCLKDFIEHY
jgi:hypothetical protein